jgi:hypothetical protein
MASADGTSRRTFVKTAAAVTAGGGIIAIMSDLAGGVPRAAAKASTPTNDEQYLVDDVKTLTDNGVEIIVPPLYKYIVTGKLRTDRKWDANELKKAQAKFEKALAQAEKNRPRTAAGLTVVVAWGLPYFETYIKPLAPKATWDAVWPRTTTGGESAVIPARKFASDPRSVVLEDNDVMVMIRSDSPVILDDVKGKLFHDSASDGYLGDIIQVTSERMGFVGRGFDKPSVAKQLAIKAGVANAQDIPDNAQLMMGYTSTQKAALPPDNISSFETLGLTTVKPGDYFAGGAAVHLSHMYEHLDKWYAKPASERAHRMFSPRTDIAEKTVTVPNGPAEVSTLAQVKADAAQGPGGHTSLLQQLTRLQFDVTDAYKVVRRAGTAVPAREDFNTLDAPFMTVTDTKGKATNPKQNRPGLHFVVFVPRSQSFHAARDAMDGILPGGVTLGTATGNGINDVLETTHRQNFLAPPRSHRSFPMADLL